jgi:hypothetical protein
MTTHTGWLQPTGLNRGQDHLATRAICEILYANLLPGITNVTDRGRYYTLYPWVLWAMDQVGVPADERTLWFRKADCLLTLISMRHGHSGEHARGAVGSDTLIKALREAEDTGEPIRLSRWARTDAQQGERYFAGKRGGLGQYYLGSLEQLGIVAWDKNGGLTWSNTTGARFATAVDAAVQRERFADCVNRDEVRLDDLEALGGLCLCQLSAQLPERDVLLELLWGDLHRRHSLGLILSLAARRPEGASLDVPTFRGATATGYLPDGSTWELPGTLDGARQRWGIYQRSEWLSIAIQGLFWATLWHIGPGRELGGFAAFGDAAVDAFASGLDVKPDVAFEDAVRQFCSSLPEHCEWTDARHEHRRALRIAAAARSAPEVARDAMSLILALVGRPATTTAWTEAKLSPRQLEQYPVNLVALGERRVRWSRLRLQDVLHDIVTTWGVRLHERVALRKLRYQLNDTFQVRATENGTLRVELIPEPVFGNPRVNQAIQILQDLGALDRQSRRPTSLGLDLLGRLDG